jgi:hypothetical protein
MQRLLWHERYIMLTFVCRSFRMEEDDKITHRWRITEWNYFLFLNILVLVLFFKVLFALTCITSGTSISLDVSVRFPKVVTFVIRDKFATFLKICNKKQTNTPTYNMFYISYYTSTCFNLFCDLHQGVMLEYKQYTSSCKKTAWNHLMLKLLF